MKNNRKGFIRRAATAALTVGIIYGINRLAFFIATMKDLLVSQKKSYYSWRFGNIYYSRQGAGDPLLLVHHLTSMGSDYEWKDIIGYLSKEHTVYTIDLPGCGRSDKEKMIYTSYLYVQAINDFVKHVIKEKTDIITSGDTSSIAVLACHSEPDLYGRLICINPESMEHMVKCTGSWQRFKSYLMLMPLIGTFYYVLHTSKCQIEKKFKKDYFSDEKNIRPEMLQAFDEAAHLGGFSSRFVCASDIGGYYTRMNIVHALKKMNHRMYIIGGADVPDIDQIIKSYVYFNPAIEYVQIEDTKLMPHMEKPAETADICRLYLDT